MVFVGHATLHNFWKPGLVCFGNWLYIGLSDFSLILALRTSCRHWSQGTLLVPVVGYICSWDIIKQHLSSHPFFWSLASTLVLYNFILKLSSVNNSFSTRTSLHIAWEFHGSISTLPITYPYANSSSDFKVSE